ncbi:hypothetical protein B0H16DRAFT_1878434 [Mycena metata]|uniref:F-box domain-containing protein n=1 Tax=Mycena metata TaxID=1033252 RepID=A0AAD7K935_9AGAR|nr:hypothetical protein B0H16DRAFT_1878434 [Mycena metata]
MSPPTSYLHLPVEVWLRCLTLCSVPQLRRISLLCWFFRTLSLPLLLRHQSFDALALQRKVTEDNWVDRVRHLHRMAVRLNKLAGAPYAPLIHSWDATFMRRSHRMKSRYRSIQNIHLFQQMDERMCATFSTTLGLYRNLTSIHVDGFAIDIEFRDTVLSLPKLREIRLSNCDISPSYSDAPPPMVSFENLRKLDINLDDPSALIQGFGVILFPNLVHLSMRIIREDDTVFNFLPRCPRLESFAVKGFSRTSPLPSLAHDTIPVLGTITGPLSLIKAFAPGRPIEAVTVLLPWGDGLSNPDDIVEACRRSTVPLRRLTLPRIAGIAPLDLLLHTLSSFPDLQELSLDVELGALSATMCRLYGRGHKRGPIDTRCPDLSDETAFDNLPPQDVSDDEANEDDLPVVVVCRKPSEEQSPFGIFSPIAQWIVREQLPLPPNLEILRFKVDDINPYDEQQDVPLAEQQQMIAALAELYPALGWVGLGPGSNSWRRVGEVWKSEGERSVIRVLPSTG